MWCTLPSWNSSRWTWQPQVNTRSSVTSPWRSSVRIRSPSRWLPHGAAAASKAGDGGGHGAPPRVSGAPVGTHPHGPVSGRRCEGPGPSALGPSGPVDRAHDRLERGGDDVGVDADAPEHGRLAGRRRHRALDVRRGDRVATGGQGVLGVVEDPDVPALGKAVEGVDERRDRAVAGAVEGPLLTLDEDVDRQRVLLAGGAGRVHRVEPQRLLRGEVLRLEDLPDVARRHLAALGVGALLHDPAELDLGAARQVELALGLEDVGDAALAGLAVDPDHGLVGTADVLGVDREVRRLPGDLLDG